MLLDDIVDLALPELPGILRATVRNAVVLTARDLCTEADIWQETVNAYVPKGLQQAEIEATDTSAEVLRIAAIKALKPGQYQQPTPDSLQLNDVANEPRRLPVRIVCRPALNTTTLPECLARWAEALLYGALYRLLKMPGQTWTNLQLAADYRMQFQAQIFEAKRLSAAGHQNGPRAVKMRPFV